MPFVNPALAGRHAHQLLHRPQASAAAQGTGVDGADRGLRGSHQEGNLDADPREEQARAQPGGIRDMAKVPSAIWVVDTNKEHLAVSEAIKLNIPVIAILDTNRDPDQVDYPIPGNDDAIRSAAPLTKVTASAVAEGLQARSGAGRGRSAPTSRLTALAECWGARNCWPVRPQAPLSRLPTRKPTTDRFADIRPGRLFMANYSAADVKRLRGASPAPACSIAERTVGHRRRFPIRSSEAPHPRAPKTPASAERATAEGLVAAKNGVLIELNSKPTSSQRTPISRRWPTRSSTRRSMRRLLISTRSRRPPLGDGTVEQAIADLSAKIGEKLELRRVQYFDGNTETYLHKRAADLPPAVGVLVEFEGTDTGAAHAVAAAGRGPEGQVSDRGAMMSPEDLVANERRIAEETAGPRVSRIRLCRRSLRAA